MKNIDWKGFKENVEIYIKKHRGISAKMLKKLFDNYSENTQAKKTDMKKLLLIAILFLLTIYCKSQSTNDSTYCICVPTDTKVTKVEMNLFHESDYTIINQTNYKLNGESIIVFYNNTPKKFRIYAIYILKNDIVIKSKCIRVYY